MTNIGHIGLSTQTALHKQSQRYTDVAIQRYMEKAFMNCDKQLQRGKMKKSTDK